MLLGAAGAVLIFFEADDLLLTLLFMSLILTSRVYSATYSVDKKQARAFYPPAVSLVRGGVSPDEGGESSAAEEVSSAGGGRVSSEG